MKGEEEAGQRLAMNCGGMAEQPTESARACFHGIRTARQTSVCLKAPWPVMIGQSGVRPKHFLDAARHSCARQTW